MAIRELSYVLHRDPDTGADRLTPVTELPDDVPDALLRRVIAVTHRSAPAAALSHTRLPQRDGGALLCSARHDETYAGVRVDARFTPDGDWPHWPVDSWLPRALAGGPGADSFARHDRRWDEALLVKFAADQTGRIAPFLADVRRLFADPAGRQLVIAEGEQETVARWIALACASLPVPLARALTFTTRTDDPAAAPQQLIGIGPDLDDAVFDRFDLVTRTHLFRVHDGLGGPGSPPLTDTWAELTAWLWREGITPKPADRADDAFTLLPLARRALAVRDWSVLASEPLRDLLAAATDAAADPTTDAAALHDLTEICSRVGAHRRPDVQQLAAALLRRRLQGAGPLEIDPVLAAAVDLPLDADTRRAVRAEYGPPPEDELRGLLGKPPTTAWVRPLHILLTAGGGGHDAVLSDAEAGVARALTRPGDRRGCADAVALLDSLGDRAFTRRVLQRLAQGVGLEQIRALRALAESAHGDWLHDHLDTTGPLPLRLAVSAVRLARGRGLDGVDLWIELVHRHFDGQVPDAAAVRLLWPLAWPSRSGQPAPREQGRVTEVCPPQLIIDAGLTRFLVHWLRHPDSTTRRYNDFTRAAAHSQGQLTESDHALAQLLHLAHEFAAGRLPLAEAVHRLPALKERVGGLDRVLDDAVDYWTARGIIRAEPEELRSTGAQRWLATGRVNLIRQYGDAVREARAQGGTLAPAQLRDPRRVAALFVVWYEPVDNARTSWRQLSDELLHDVLGAVLPHLDERDLSEVAQLLLRRGGEPWVGAWNKWRHGIR
ncbi:GTPase-associated protein 1-related protein [Streptomyces sp. NPDC087212]|uniref:GTPase-associated protein 1-related protein n=1 Tax=Streptomyces sp. NPDC087212 TaxID=3365766 RepID=UPI003815702D